MRRASIERTFQLLVDHLGHLGGGLIGLLLVAASIGVVIYEIYMNFDGLRLILGLGVFPALAIAILVVSVAVLAAHQTFARFRWRSLFTWLLLLCICAVVNIVTTSSSLADHPLAQAFKSAVQAQWAEQEASCRSGLADRLGEALRREEDACRHAREEAEKERLGLGGIQGAGPRYKLLAFQAAECDKKLSGHQALRAELLTDPVRDPRSKTCAGARPESATRSFAV